VGTAADVYSLGVLLYELLTGERPYRLRRASPAMLEDAILHAEPRRPSDAVADRRLARPLRGDLDVIVLKALKKAPGERYGSVIELAEDIWRHLDGEPVRARPDGWTYRSAKFIARHRVGVAAAALAAGALIGGAGLALWQGREALAQQRRAEQVKTLMAGLFREADPYGGAGRTLSAVELLQQAQARIDRIDPAYSELRIELLTLVGASLLNLEDTIAAEPVIQRAVAEAASRLATTHPLALRARLQQLHVLRFRGRTTEMEAELRALEPLIAAQGGQREQVQLLMQQAHFAIDAGRYADAEAAARLALDRARPAFGGQDPATLEAAMLVALAGLYGARPPAQALPPATHAFELVRAAYADRPRHPRLIDMRHIHGRALANAGRLAEGIAQIRQAAADAEAVFGPSSRLLGFVLGNLARYERAAGELDRALASSTRSLAIHRQHSQDESYTVAGGLTARGVILLAAERPADAQADLAAATATLTRLFGADHIETLIARFNLGLAIGLAGRPASGEAQVRQALAGYRLKYADEQVRPLLALARLQREDGRAGEALFTLQDALAQAGGDRATALDRAQVQGELGLALLAAGRAGEAIPPLQQALQQLGAQQTHRTPLQDRLLAALRRARGATTAQPPTPVR
jgi:eukaryotic-like serine/threonine-protein kinase